MGSRPRVLLTRRWPQTVEARLAERYALTVSAQDEAMSPEALCRALDDYDALCPTVTDRLSASIIGGEPRRARILANYGVGFSHIDLAAAAAAKLTVTNTPDVLTDCTADLALTLLLMLARRAGEGERLVRSGAWHGWRPTQMLGTRVTDKTLGIIGFGRIGQAVARRAHAGFGMRVQYYSRSPVAADIAAACGASPAADLDRLLETSDFVSLHCPGGAANHHLVNAERIARMRPGSLLINTARGEVIDHDALATALVSGQLAGAGLDVYPDEPRVPDALLELDNVVLLPHLGSATEETRVAMGMRVLANLDAFFEGGQPRDTVELPGQAD